MHQSLGASTTILSKDIDRYAFMCGSNFYESDIMWSIAIYMGSRVGFEFCRQMALTAIRQTCGYGDMGSGSRQGLSATLTLFKPGGQIIPTIYRCPHQVLKPQARPQQQCSLTE